MTARQILKPHNITLRNSKPHGFKRWSIYPASPQQFTFTRFPRPVFQVQIWEAGENHTAFQSPDKRKVGRAIRAYARGVACMHQAQCEGRIF